MTDTERGSERRCNTVAEFPLVMSSGEIIEHDRRRPDLVSRQPFCSGIANSALEPVLSQCETRYLKPGEVLLSPDKSNQHLFLIMEGRLKVHIDAVDSEEGFLIEEGECVGEISVIDGMLPSAFVVAEIPSRVLAIHESTLWNEVFKIPGTARNFMKQLADRMRKRSEAMQVALEHKLRLEHLQRELCIAHNIQENMLPRQDQLFSRHPGIDVYAMMLPAKEVGGDFYDMFSLDEQRVCIAIGDVSGKGVPAALFMVRAMTLLRTEMLKNPDPGETLANLNNILCADHAPGMFVTLLVIVVDVANGEYTLANGGHNRPLFSSDGKRYRYLELPDGIVAGVKDNALYATASGKLDRDTVLVLYTDGITEARNTQREFYTEERLNRHLEQSRAASAADIADHILEQVNAFASGVRQSDDITLVVLRFPGTPSAQVP